MFYSLLNSTYAASRTSLSLTPHDQWGVWGHARSWDRTQQGQLPSAVQRDIPDTMISCLAWKIGRKGRWVVWSKDICLPKSPLYVIEHCLPRYVWTLSCPWEQMNKFPVLLVLACRYLLNTLYLKPWIFSLLPFWFSSHPTGAEWAIITLGISYQLGLNHDNNHICDISNLLSV